MTKTLKLLFAVCTAAILMIACKDDDVVTDLDLFNDQIAGQTSKEWYATDFTMEGIPGLLSCRLDDTITIFRDGTYSYDGGELNCGGEDVDSKNGTWEVDLENQTILFDGNEVAEIVSITETELTLAGVYSSDTFGTFDVEGTYEIAE